jgi:hypothetical protein
VGRAGLACLCLQLLRTRDGPVRLADPSPAGGLRAGPCEPESLNEVSVAWWAVSAQAGRPQVCCPATADRFRRSAASRSFPGCVGMSAGPASGARA